MDLSKNNFDGFKEFFSKNESGALTRYEDLHNKFKSIFNEIIRIGCSTNFKSAQKGASIILFLRATKYLFTVHKLSIEGHTEEARILLRSIIELTMLAHLISKSNQVYIIWEECNDLRLKNTDKNGVVNVGALKDQKYKVDEIIKKHRELFQVSPETKYLERIRGEFSEYFSHENIFNIVSRVEFGKDKSEVYIGNSFESNDGRMSRMIQMTIDISADILKLIERLVPIK